MPIITLVSHIQPYSYERVANTRDTDYGYHFGLFFSEKQQMLIIIEVQIAMA